jgi:hypothetical protein
MPEDAHSILADLSQELAAPSVKRREALRNYKKMLNQMSNVALKREVPVYKQALP